MNSTRLILTVILLCQFALGILYATRTPPWQAPDEPAHFNYVRALVETGAFPILQLGDYDKRIWKKSKPRNFRPIWRWIPFGTKRTNRRCIICSPRPRISLRAR